MQGVRVVDFTRVLAGPWAAQHLADQGADVVKVEPPEGDETRAFAPIVRGASTYFVSCNRNKRSITLDLRSEAGREVARRLVDAADVLLHNWRPGIDAEIGLDAASTRARNPRLVHVSLSAFGADGPPEWTRRAGYDLVLQAMGGAMSFTGRPGDPPVRAGTPIADLTAGLLVTNAVLQGLLHRATTGEGQAIVVSMMQAQAACLAYHYSRYTVTGEAETQRGNAHRGLVPYDVYPCREGHLALACGNDGIWQRLRSALGVEDRPSWRTNPGRVAAREEVDRAVRDALAGLDAREADAVLTAAGVPCGPVQGVGEVAGHPAVREVSFPHPALGEVRVPGPIVATATTVAHHRRPPLLGEHRDEILAELGLSEEHRARLAAAGAFGPPG
jgi:crotonobetainyl-CoA:carnitine CoA-transferase CaiB-like acyl-CoA transferase